MYKKMPIYYDKLKITKARNYMLDTSNKKALNMMIMEILREYTDEDHAITQQGIRRKLKEDFDVDCDRRTVKSNIEFLQEMGDRTLSGIGYEISDDKGYRLLRREFDENELRLLIDCVLFSKALSYKNAKCLIEKLKKLGGKNFYDNSPCADNIPALSPVVNSEMAIALDTVSKAIAKNKKIEFIYNNVGKDLKLHARRDEPDKVNPYEIVISNGRFYLICNYDKYDNIAHIRIDRMTGVKMLNEKRKPQNQVAGIKRNFDLGAHMAEHFYMFSGESIYAKIKTTPGMISDFTDWFGANFKIIEDNDSFIVIRVKCNRTALRFWALQYGPYVEVLEPEDLRNQIKEDIAEMYNKYGAEK